MEAGSHGAQMVPNVLCSKGDLGVLILLPQPLECWDCRCVLSLQFM